METMHRQVLVPLNGSPDAEEALPHALVRAQEIDAGLRLLRVVPTLTPAQLLSSGDDRERAAWLYLITIAEKLQGQGVEVSYRVRLGAILPTILDEARRAELVVVARGTGGIVEHVLGDTLAARILSRASCRVMLISPDESQPASTDPVRSFNEDAAAVGPLVQRPLGVRTVALDRIVGSVGRAHELCADFLPRYRRAGDIRYRRIVRAMQQGEIMPPVELYKLGYRYYALDGNHRIAAARRLGQREIDALVTEFLPVGDADAHRVFVERRAFEQATGLTRVGARRPGHYPRLQALIREYAEGEKIADPEDAARLWHERLYLPLADRLRAAQLESLFPGERTADMLVHLADLRAAEEEFLGRPVSWDEALEKMLVRFRSSQQNARLRLPTPRLGPRR